MKIINITHTFLAVLISFQVLLWSIGGFFMHYLDFSDLYTNVPAPKIELSKYKLKLSDIEKISRKKYPQAKIISLKLINLLEQPFYLVNTNSLPDKFLINQQGEIVEKLNPLFIRQLAEYHNEKKASPGKIEYLEKSTGNYFSDTPVYRVVFADQQKTEYYFSPQTGDLLAKRKALWFFYNRMWEFHLMKYTTNKTLNKFLLLITAWLSVIVVITGLLKFLWLIGRRFSSDK